MRVLVLGAYGLIGAEIVKSLEKAGHQVTGFVRSRDTGARLLPGVELMEGDISKLVAESDWRSVIAGFDAVVNASGALQTGLKDRLGAVQCDAIKALVAACDAGEVKTFVQISAPGAEHDASTEFMRTKAQADAALRASELRWVIFKPGLVIAPTAYGGTALIRMLAGFPLITPLASSRARIQTVSVRDVCNAVVSALEGRVPMRTDYDLVEAEERSLENVVATFRCWMGLRPAPVLRVPAVIARIIARICDLAGWLGWRSPLRSTAVTVLNENVLGDSTTWRDVSGRQLASLEVTLEGMPATIQERLFARAQFASVISVLILSGFFFASGVIGMFRLSDAAGVLNGVLSTEIAKVLTISGAILDIILGGAILVRPMTRFAALGMVALSSAYLALGSILTPEIWANPLGPFVKIFPVIGLALCVFLITEDR